MRLLHRTCFSLTFFFFLPISEKFVFVFISRSVDFVVVVDCPFSSVRPESAVLVAAGEISFGVPCGGF